MKLLSKKSTILIVGFGSIGKRHFENLKVAGFSNVAIYDSSPLSYKDFDAKVITELNEKNFSQFNIVFVCTPSHSHIEPALLAAKAGCHLFIEKPLSHSLKDLSKLIKLVNQKKLVTMVAANMRFHPALQFVKVYLDGNKLGKIYRISHEFGQYLPHWRPGSDYKKGYAMKKVTGGGILLDDIHEFDLLFWLLDFKKPLTSHIIKSKAEKITIDSEDQVASVFLFSRGIIGTVCSDYLSKSYRRGITIIGEKGNLTWNYKENSIWLETEKGKKRIFRRSRYDTNDMYKEEIKYFLECVSSKKETENNVERAAFLLKELGIK